MPTEMSRNEINQQLQKLDILIRQGQQGQARDILLTVGLKKLPREHLVDFADLARRLNMPKVILQLLREIIYQDKPGEEAATIHEQALYATGLSRLGVFQEAQNILKTLDTSEIPEVSLFFAQNSMLQWDYASAIPKMKRYLRFKALSDYQRVVGKVNLAACYIGEMRWNESDQILQEIWSEIENLSTPEERQSYGLLYANSLGIAVHSLFLRGRIQEAKDLIATANKILLGTKSRYELLVKKWQAILDVFSDLSNSDSTSKFKSLVEESRKARDGETLRDLEFFESLAFRDDQLFIKVYHGSPYASYRKRIRKIYKPEFPIPKMIEWDLNASSHFEKKRVFDISKGCEDGGTARLSSSPLLMRLLQTLSKDFYRPATTGSLFSVLYPSEYFNPQTSPNRVYHVIKRLRIWFQDHAIPIDIEAQEDRFTLASRGPYHLRVSFQNIRISKNESWLESLSHHLGQRDFSIEDAIEELQLPPTTAKKFLIWACQQGHVRRMKKGKTDLFRWKT